MTYFRVPISLVELIKRTFRRIIKDDCNGLSAELAFYYFLSLFPALLFGVALMGYLPVKSSVGAVLSRLNQVAPPQVAQIVGGQLNQLIAGGGNAKLLTIGMVVTIWSSSSAMVAIIEALNRVYEIQDTRPWWKVRLLAIVLTIGMVLLSLTAFAFVLIGPILAHWLDSSLRIGSGVSALWNIVRWVLAFLLAVIAVDIVYRYGPDADREWVLVTPGSLVATLLWIGASLGLKAYIASFGNFNVTYGAIGGVIVLLLWFYISGFALLIGAELDSQIDCVLAERANLNSEPGARKTIGPGLGRLCGHPEARRQ